MLEWAEAPEPHAGPGQVRVAVRAASVNPIDWKTFSGMLAGGQPMAGVGYVGYDAAGVVDEVGEGVTGVSVGDDVLGRGRNTQANRVESDHGRLKQRLRPMRGLKTDAGARTVTMGHALVQNVRRGFYELGTEEPPTLRMASAFTELAQAV